MLQRPGGARDAQVAVSAEAERRHSAKLGRDLDLTERARTANSGVAGQSTYDDDNQCRRSRDPQVRQHTGEQRASTDTRERAAESGLLRILDGSERAADVATPLASKQ
jgi:hypothetical protein